MSPNMFLEKEIVPEKQEKRPCSQLEQSSVNYILLHFFKTVAISIHGILFIKLLKNMQFASSDWKVWPNLIFIPTTRRFGRFDLRNVVYVLKN